MWSSNACNNAHSPGRRYQDHTSTNTSTFQTPITFRFAIVSTITTRYLRYNHNVRNETGLAQELEWELDRLHVGVQ